MVINPRLMLSMRTFILSFVEILLISISGCEPLTPDDIAEIIVFAAGRRENVVLADSLIFPNHQVIYSLLSSCGFVTDLSRLLQLSCTKRVLRRIVDCDRGKRFKHFCL